MPIYEFRCEQCQQRANLFVRNMSSPVNAVCPTCGSNLIRLMSSFGIAKTTQSVHQDSGSSGMSDSPDYYKDPRNIGRWAENKFSEMGMEMPSNVKGMIDAAREGEMPEAVKDMQPNVKEL